MEIHVKVARKTSSHPNFSLGSPLCYVYSTDGENYHQLPPAIPHGKRVRFVIDAEDHPFYLTISNYGGPGYPGRLKFPGNDGIEKGVLEYQHAPLEDKLYGQCGSHYYMGLPFTSTVMASRQFNLVRLDATGEIIQDEPKSTSSNKLLEKQEEMIKKQDRMMVQLSNGVKKLNTIERVGKRMLHILEKPDGHS
jgi:hypothetical protein